MAARSAKNKGLISPSLARRCERLDGAAHFARHATAEKMHAFLVSIAEATGAGLPEGPCEGFSSTASDKSTESTASTGEPADEPLELDSRTPSRTEASVAAAVPISLSEALSTPSAPETALHDRMEAAEKALALVAAVVNDTRSEIKALVDKSAACEAAAAQSLSATQTLGTQCMAGLKAANDLSVGLAAAISEVQAQIGRAVEYQVAAGIRSLDGRLAAIEGLSAGAASADAAACRATVDAESMRAVEARLATLESAWKTPSAVETHTEETPTEETPTVGTPAVEPPAEVSSAALDKPTPASGETLALHGKAETTAEADDEVETAAGPDNAPIEDVTEAFEFHDLCSRLRRLRLNSHRASTVANEVLNMVEIHDNFEENPFAEMAYYELFGPDHVTEAADFTSDDCAAVGGSDDSQEESNFGARSSSPLHPTYGKSSVFSANPNTPGSHCANSSSCIGGRA